MERNRRCAPVSLAVLLPLLDRSMLLTVILADAINLGLAKIAEACPGTTFYKLDSLGAWHVRDETYSKALAEIVNYQHRLPFSSHWGAGTTSSSDERCVTQPTCSMACFTMSRTCGARNTIPIPPASRTTCSVSDRRLGKPKAMLAGANGNNSLGPSGTMQMSVPDVANWVRPAVARSPRHIKIGGLPSVIRDANC
jgi:Tn3 transposase DDE domain